jgi:hypothetical protein
MKNSDRRTFIKQSGILTTGAFIGSPLINQALKQKSPNDTIHMAVIGIRSRGKNHYRSLVKIPNVKIATLCDIDERLFPEAVAEVEELTGYKPAKETEYRKVLEDKNIDLHCHTQPLACTADHMGLSGREGCICGEACFSHDTGRKKNGGGGPEV